MSMTPDAVRRLVRSRLAERGETQADLAVRLSVSDSVISNILHGRRKQPAMLDRIFRALGINAALNAGKAARSKPKKSKKARPHATPAPIAAPAEAV